MSMSPVTLDREKDKFREQAGETVVAVTDSGSTAILTDIDNKLSNLENYTDGLEALNTSILGSVDGLEGLNTTLNATASAIAASVDSLEAFTDNIEPLLSAIGDNTDTVETKLNDIYTRQNDSSQKTQVVGGGNTLLVNANGSIAVGGSSAVGLAPVNNPVSMSGVDGGGLKRHLLTKVDGTLKVETDQLNTLGQKTMATSAPVVLPSDQSPIDAGVILGLQYVPNIPDLGTTQTKLTTDPDGQLKVRGDALTDEGGFRDDFTGNSAPGWQSVATGGGGVSVSFSNSNAVIATGTNASTFRLSRAGDYGPMGMVGLITISQRIANDDIRFGFRDNINSPGILAEFQFNSTNPTLVNAISQSDSAAVNVQTSSVTMPNNSSTATAHKYEIIVLPKSVAFKIDDVLVAKHETHIPGPNDAMYIQLGGSKTAGGTSTTITCDYIDWNNHNNLQITNDYDSQPVLVAENEDTHHISGSVTTSATTADQTIVAFTVPTGKVMWLTGYSVNSSNIAATVVKVGKGTLTEPVASVVDSIIFRAFPLPANGTRFEEFAKLRRVAVGGDVVKIAVTPSANTSTVWRGTIDYILR
jgi:hypothetical protein